MVHCALGMRSVLAAASYVFVWRFSSGGILFFAAIRCVQMCRYCAGTGDQKEIMFLKQEKTRCTLKAGFFHNSQASQSRSGIKSVPGGSLSFTW